ncbi:glutathione S-transferase [Legionella quinlivanii]|uniref:Glutathione S-transferase n=1 Tax=Legionella quinlivanii TaxID=45073 RepID=A0A0W0XLL9_9GAMM|nr:glutathione S-transferase N-terminal domain-containing protein [Legionella quinlivanii]KTD45487.1 glutathione S-transferase [Legionella quinlivanii]MCW8450282.1 glutathione S-transferase N-terminal domain-containing protein [Legionella quinlivanii]SEG45859.1 glutathione S-transferase [Legionella quinlivanii DSM 21216]STY11568.1 glutathione S-transferase [Legionella quinlivanii]
MKLYYSKGACSLGVRILINELGLDVEYESVNLKSKTTERGDDFLAINPKGAVPVLEITPEKRLTENVVILQYLADAHNAASLLPAVGDLKRYRILEICNYLSSEAHKTIGILFNPAVTEEMKEKIIIPAIHQKLNYLNSIVKDNSFAAGSHFTIADGYFYVILSWLPHFKIDLNHWPALYAYFHRMSEYPAVMRSLKEEQ